MESTTVFGHLALRFGVHPENLATEALCFILRTSPAASRAFTALAREFGLDEVGNLRFETQQGGVEQSIPDMKGYDEEGRLRVVVENKFWAGLTENQPVTYIRELRAEVSALVLFVVPNARLDLIWNEVVVRCKSAGIAASPVEKPATIRAANMGGRHCLAATPWSVLLEALSLAATAAGEIDARDNIVQLQDLCRRMDEEAFLPLRGDELTNLEMARRLINFSNLPFAIVDEAVQLGLCIKKKESNFRNGSGTYIRIGEFTAWVGFSANLWSEWGASPIWVNFYPESGQIPEVRKRLARFRVAVPPRCFDASINNYRWVAVPIFLPTYAEKQRIVEDAVRQIRDLNTELGVHQPISEAVASADGVERDANLDYRPPTEGE